MSATPHSYDETSIRVLKGLEPVRERPGMYTRTDSPAHILQEVIDNAADEALGGFATKVQVVFNDDESITVRDNGRGIPVGLHKEEKVPVVTLAFTRLHAGGKFDKTAGGAYAFSGGLHGVGVAVTTALSKKVLVTIRRDGKVHEVEYLDGGRSIGNVKIVGDCAHEDSGTDVQVWPDPKYFDSPRISKSEIKHLLQSKAVLLPGVEVSFTADGDTLTWHYEGGLAQYLKEEAGDAEPIAPIYVGEKFQDAGDVSEGETSFAPGEGASYAFAWYPDGGPSSPSFVNLIPTREGGTHVSGLKAGVYEAVKNFIEHRALLPRGVKLQQEDVANRLAFVLSTKVLDPQFQGQTKEKLNSRSAHKLVASMVKDPFEVWLNHHVEAGKAIAELAIKQALARQKNGKTVEKRKSSSVTTLPGKLSDCESREDNEIFFVEGDSAGGSAKQARNRENQAVLPLRGKVLNTFEVERGRLFANNEVHDISVALGVDPHNINDDPEHVLAHLRYDRIMIMTDADVDGAHIQTLLLTLFYSHFPLLLTEGHVWVVQSPLFRIDVASGGKGKPARRIYALDKTEYQKTMEQLAREGVKENRIDTGRFKGLGEMNAEQLKETSMDPATRSVYRFVYDRNEAQAMHATFDLLMGKAQSAGRRQMLATHAAMIEADM